MIDIIDKYIEKIRNDLYIPCKILVHLERMKNELIKYNEMDEGDFSYKLKSTIKDSMYELENDF